MEDPTTIFHTVLQDSLELLGHRLIHAEGKERLEYWVAFEVGVRLID